MKITTFSALVALWIEYELGEAHNVRPKGLKKGSPLVGQSLALQGHGYLERQPGYKARRPDLQERYILLITPHEELELDVWEMEIGAALLKDPLLLVPPGPVECEAEQVERISYEVEALIGGRAA